MNLSLFYTTKKKVGYKLAAKTCIHRSSGIEELYRRGRRGKNADRERKSARERERYGDRNNSCARIYCLLFIYFLLPRFSDSLNNIGLLAGFWGKN